MCSYWHGRYLHVPAAIPLLPGVPPDRIAIAEDSQKRAHHGYMGLSCAEATLLGIVESSAVQWTGMEGQPSAAEEYRVDVAGACTSDERACGTQGGSLNGGAAGEALRSLHDGLPARSGGAWPGHTGSSSLSGPGSLADADTSPMQV